MELEKKDIEVTGDIEKLPIHIGNKMNGEVTGDVANLPNLFKDKSFYEYLKVWDFSNLKTLKL